MFWQLLTCSAALALALNTEYEVGKAIQFLRDVDEKQLPCDYGRVVDNKNYTTVPLGEHTYAVLTIIKSDAVGTVCSGTIVARRYVLTAASCVPGDTTRYHEGIVLAGDVNYIGNKTFERTNVQIRTVSQYYYSSPPEMVVLLKTHRPFIFYRRYVSFGRLTPDRSYPAELNISATAVGFAVVGKTVGIKTADNFWTIPGVNCSSDLGKPVLCSRLEPMKSVCKGDRGGPLVLNRTVYGFIRDRELENPNETHCGAPVKYSTFWFAGGYAEWIYFVTGKPPDDDRLQHEPSPPVAAFRRSPAAAVLAGACWTLQYLISCSINLLLSH